MADQKCLERPEHIEDTGMNKLNLNLNLLQVEMLKIKRLQLWKLNLIRCNETILSLLLIMLFLIINLQCQITRMLPNLVVVVVVVSLSELNRQ